MTLSYLDIVITAVILVVVLAASHRLGQVNPVSTGRLSKRLSAVELKVAEQGEKIDALDDAVKLLAESSAVTATEIGAMRIEVAADRGLAERSWASISRLEHFFMEDAFRARREGK